jgi:uncharacterized DUF497 family protein
VEITVRRTRRSQSHIARHGIKPWEVDEFIEKRRYYVRRQGDRYVVIGRTAGRILVVVLERSRVSSGNYEIITARDATSAEKNLFGRRRRGFR